MTGAQESPSTPPIAGGMLKKHDSSEDLQVGVRVYTDLTPDEQQSWLSYIVACVTLTLYCGWTTVLLLLLVASFYSSTVL
jgi:hypothetical protein